MATLSTALHEKASLEMSVAAPCERHSPLWLTIPTSLTRVCAPNMEITIPTSLTRVCAADHGTLYGNSNCAPSWYPPQRLVLDRNPLGGAVMSTGLHGCQALISLSLRSCQIATEGRSGVRRGARAQHDARTPRDLGQSHRRRGRLCNRSRAARQRECLCN